MDEWRCLLLLVAVSFGGRAEGSANLFCTDEQFACKDGSGCIPSSRFCDRRKDCRDGSDEIPRILPLNSTETGIACRKYEDICHLPKNQQSKSNIFCTKDSVCTDEEFACEDYSGCIRSSSFCNRRKDCRDGSDEIPRILPLNWTETGIACRKYEDICHLPKNQQSKSNILCTKDSVCTDEEFACEDYSGCIRSSSFCNRRKDCRDGSDEIPRILPLNSTETGIACRKYEDICHLPKNQQSKSNILCTKDSVCTDEEFACEDGSGCIPSFWFCDRRKDCRDGSDEIPHILPLNSTETGIACRKYEDICRLPKNQQSKSNILCTKDSVCTDEEFACEDYSGCIRSSSFCNRRKDCRDGSDEIPRILPLNSTETGIACRKYEDICHLPKNQQSKSNILCTKDSVCTDEEFACEDYSGCIRSSSFCDRRKDCRDGSDEIPRILPLNSTETGIACRKYEDICHLPKNQQSKSNILCTKDSVCTDEEFACEDYSGCIRSSSFCDRRKDCRDGSDEMTLLLPLNSTETGISCRQWRDSCLLPKNQQSKRNVFCRKDTRFECEDGSNTFRSRDFCNGFKSCKDGSDENLFQRGLLNDDIMCEGTHWKTGKSLMCALPKKHHCDFKSICKSDVDECLCAEGDSTSFLDQDCFRCLSHQYKVIPIGKLCNGVFDCSDLSDECLCKNDNSMPQLCSLAVFETMELRLNEGSSRGFLCDSRNNSIRVDEEQICNGRIDCSNKVDEFNCRVSDEQTEDEDHVYRCRGESRNATRCDGKPECAFDKNEECDCDEIPGFCQYMGGLDSGFGCDGAALHLLNVCDGSGNCMKKEDELFCTNRTHFYCHANPTSYTSAQNVCDQKVDCADESDEFCEESFRCFKEGNNGSGTLYIHKYKLCDGAQDCAGGADECQDWCINSSFSSNSSLITNKGVLGGLYTISFVAICGNIIVFIITIRAMFCPPRRRRLNMIQQHRNEKIIISRVLILSLSISDALVVIYTMAICMESSITEGKYCLVDHDWRSGSSCSALGALLLIGSEQSVFTMLLITVFRLYTIWRPLGSVSVRKFSILLALTWIISISLGVIPLLPHLEDTFTTSIWYADNKLFSAIEQRDVKNFTYWLLLMHVSSNKSHSDIGAWSTLEELIGEMRPNFTANRRFGFYSSHTVCIPDFFPDLANTTFWWYSLLLIVINFLGFLAMAIGYSLIYRLATETNQARDSKMESELSSEMQKRLTIIITTDFVCWIPVCIMAFLQLSGVEIPNDLRLVVGMIIIPINSALNPIIYSGLLTIIVKKCKQFREIICNRCIELATRNVREPGGGLGAITETTSV